MTGAETLLAIVIILLIVAGVTWAGLYVWTSQVRRLYADQATRVERILDASDADLAVIAHAAVLASPSAPPPYGPAAQDLQLRLQRAQESFANLETQLVALRRSEPRPAPSLGQRILSVVRQLGAWRAHLGAMRSLAQQMTTLEKQLAGAQQQAEQVRNLPVGVAGRVRSAQGALERTIRICLGLQQTGVRGEALETLVDTARTHQNVLDTVPAYFRQGSDEAVLQNATQESTSDAWRKLNNIEKSVFDALRRAQSWQDQFNEGRNMIGALQAEVATAEHILQGLPPSVDASAHSQQLGELQDKAQAIQTDWQAPEVHRLAEISNIATRHTVSVRELSANVMLVHKTFQEFEQAFGVNAAALSRIEAVLNALGKSRPCPVHWLDSAAEHERLCTVRDDIGDPSTPRDSSRLEADLDRALDLGLQAGALEARVNDVRGRHQQLLALLANDEFGTLEQWFHEAALLYVDAAHYAAENWPDEDGVTTLKADAAALLEHEQSLKPLFTNQLIPENDVQAWINRATVYMRERREFAARVASIERTFGALQRSEQTSQTTLTQTLGALARLNQGLAQALGAPEVIRVWNDVMTRWEEGRDHTDALQDRAQGTVADKAEAIGAWMNRCALDLQDLDQAVEAEASAVKQQLNEQLESLFSVAPFDSEQSVATAQQLLTEVPARPIGGKGAQAASATNPATLVEQTNVTFQRHTQFAEALDDLDHRVISQVEPRVTRLDTAHEAAWSKLQELQALEQQFPATHPFEVSCDEAAQLFASFKQAEASLDDLRQSGHTVKSVVGRLDSLIQQFQYIANQGAGVQADMEREVVHLRAVVDQLDQWTHSLERFRDSQSSDHVLAEIIDRRLGQIDDGLADIERRYKGQPLPLEHASRELERLLSATRGSLEVPRDAGIEVVTAQEIQPY
ncbi:MAG TPA: hypothetical protein VGK81_01880 [Anaerolineae bacterium]